MRKLYSHALAIRLYVCCSEEAAAVESSWQTYSLAELLFLNVIGNCSLLAGVHQDREHDGRSAQAVRTSLHTRGHSREQGKRFSDSCFFLSFSGSYGLGAG